MPEHSGIPPHMMDGEALRLIYFFIDAPRTLWRATLLTLPPPLLDAAVITKRADCFDGKPY